MRLPLAQWENIFRNLHEDNEYVEIVWLDGTDEWVLCFDCELFEDGFKTEKEAMERLDYLQRELL